MIELWELYKMINNEIIDKIYLALKPFNGLDLKDQLVAIALTSIVSHILSKKQQNDPGFDSDILFDYDPEPYLNISWHQTKTGMQDEFIFRFEPLRVEYKEKVDLIAAYDRAMAII